MEKNMSTINILTSQISSLLNSKESIISALIAQGVQIDDPDNLKLSDIAEIIQNAQFATSNEYTTISYVNEDGILTWQETKGGNSSTDTNSTVIDVEVGPDITIIDEYAFYGCTKLSSIEIPENVISIGNHAFYNCTSLTSVTYNKQISQISNMTDKYWGLKDGTKISASDGIIIVTGDNTETFEVPHTIITDTNNSTSSIVNEDGILTWQETKGEENQYSENTTIKSVVIGTDTSSIGDHAFQYCTSLSSVTIPTSVSSIGTSTFSNCSSLTSVTIPNGISSINNGTFDGCTSLASIEIPETVESIGMYAFWHCTSLTSIEIPNGVSSIDYWAFRDCPSLLSVTYNKPMSEISSMNNKYWGLQVETKISALDGVIIVAESNTETFEPTNP
jgi:hypothetical protein